MSNHPPFSHPDLHYARMLLAELKGFAFPDLENDRHAQRAACRIVEAIRRELIEAGKKPPVPKDDPQEMEW